MNKLDRCISEISFILLSLKVLKRICDSGDCNDCGKRECKYRPKLGEMVRYNCPFYERKEGEDGKESKPV